MQSNYTSQESAALQRVQYLLEENSIAYLAGKSERFRSVVERLYRDINQELAA